MLYFDTFQVRLSGSFFNNYQCSHLLSQHRATCVKLCQQYHNLQIYQLKKKLKKNQWNASWFWKFPHNYVLKYPSEDVKLFLIFQRHLVVIWHSRKTD